VLEEGRAVDVVRRVEQAPLAELVGMSIDDVQVQMDSYLDPGTSATSLYRRWEKQQWAVQDLDLSVDSQHWAALDEATQALVRRTMTLFFIGEQAVTDTLGPILHAAPREDERIFLATQVADEARHTVFFQRFFDEVLEVHGGLEAALRAVGSDATAGFRQIFRTYLVTATDAVRREPANRRAWVEAVVTYHVVIEGFLALSGQRNLLRFTRATGFMPGFHAGFTAVARDESRHIGFGVLALRRRVQEQPEMARAIALTLLALAEPAVLTIVDPHTRLMVPDPADQPPELRQSPLEFRDYTTGQLAKRMRSIGLSGTAVEEVRQAYRAHFDRCWSLYETTHGVEHPVRWFQRHEAAAAAGVPGGA
jgi:ribonucleoside-diphosphate reductase beta chain